MSNAILFIDSHVSEYSTLLAGLASDVEVHLLNANEEGVLQIATILQGRTGLDSIQIMSHGSSGSLSLGSGVLNSSNLDSYSDALAQIGSSLSATGDILLYGCDVAQGDSGLSFINQLATITGAEVAASTDLTGNAALGGDWVLEANTGAVETSLPFTDSALQNYSNLLASVPTAGATQFGTVTFGSNSVTTSENSVTDADIEAGLGLTGTLDALAGGDATGGSAVKYAPIAVGAGSILSFNWNFSGGDSGSGWKDFSFVAIDGVAQLIRQFGVAGSGVFSTGLSAGTHTIGFGSLNYTDTAGSPTLAITGLDVTGLDVTTPFSPGFSNKTLSPIDINYIDTQFVDTFAVTTGSLAGSGYHGISGGQDSLNETSLTSAYGTLTMNKTTGDYSYAPNSEVIESLTTNSVDSFVLVTFDGTAITHEHLTFNMIQDSITTESTGDDVLIGAVGINSFAGLTGKDSYYVDDEGDSITEAANRGEVDNVYSTAAAYTLSDNVENLMLQGTAIIGAGNSLDNYLFGNVANNRFAAKYC